MSKANSLKNRSWWNALTREERSERMNRLNKIRWSKVSKEERRKLALKMVRAKKKKTK